MDLNMISKDFPNIFLTQIWPKLSPNLRKKKIWSWSCKAINLVAYFRWKTPARYPEQELMTKRDGKHSTGMQKKLTLYRLFMLKKIATINHFCAYIGMGNIQSHFPLLLFIFYMCDCWRMLVNNGVCMCGSILCVFIWVCVSVRCTYVYVSIHMHLSIYMCVHVCTIYMQLWEIMSRNKLT